MWWSSYPAIMKGFIDRTFLPGIAIASEQGKIMPIKLFKGISSRIVVTSDTPRFYKSLFKKNPLICQFKKGTLQFCGIHPVSVSYIAPIKNSSENFRKKNTLKRLKK